LREKVLKLEKWGGRGLELFGREAKWQTRIREIQESVKGTQVNISAICIAYTGTLISRDPEERNKAIVSIKELLKFAGDLGSTGLVIVPGGRDRNPLSNPEEARKIFVETMPELGQFALQCKTRVLIKPLHRQESFFLRIVADAAAICKDINHPGIGLTADFYHMAFEETSDCGAFLSAGKYLHHVHLGSRKRNLPGQDDRSFIDGFRGLKMIGYSDYCSLECDCVGNPEIEFPKSFEFLRKQWNEVKV
jgi:sugar phosphate isomerase/epimerase